MAIYKVSAYQQLQQWHSVQKAATNKLAGDPGAASLADNSSIFVNISNNFDSAKTGLDLQAALIRYQQKIAAAQAANGSGGLTSAVDFNKQAGASVLARLGIGGWSEASSSDYSAPVNADTGYQYVKTTGASVSLISSLNILA